MDMIVYNDKLVGLLLLSAKIRETVARASSPAFCVIAVTERSCCITSSVRASSSSFSVAMLSSNKVNMNFFTFLT